MVVECFLGFWQFAEINPSIFSLEFLLDQLTLSIFWIKMLLNIDRITKFTTVKGISPSQTFALIPNGGELGRR